MADGKTPSEFPIIIFGGEHGDLPLNEHAGSLLGETVAGMAESCIIDLSGLGTKSAERRFMLAFLEKLYRKASGEPFHVIFDEADLWAPQKSSEPMLQNLMEQIVRRGRVKGFIPWLITQRPAVISKDVLSQADGLVAMKLTASQDRDALGAWIEGQADRAEEKRILARLPQVERGHGIVWIPGRGILTEAAFPQKKTFDSSRTPKRGEKRLSRELKPIDLGTLRERLAAVEEETKANDPKTLKAEIAKLKKQLAEKPVAPVAAPDRRAIEDAEARGWNAGVAATFEAMAPAANELRIAIDQSMNAMRSLAGVSQSKLAKAVGRLPVSKPVLHPMALRADVRPRPTTNGHLPPGERAVLIAAAQFDGVEREQLTVLTGYKRSSRDAYIQRLREKGYVEVHGSLVKITVEGQNALPPDYEPLPTGDALREYWLNRLPEGERRILQVLAEAYPESVARPYLDEATGYKRSSRDAYLQRMKAKRLWIPDGGAVKAADELFA
jgi:hypothetical protein